MDEFAEIRSFFFRVIVADEPIPPESIGWAWTAESGTEEFEAGRQKIQVWNRCPTAFKPGENGWCTVIDKRYCILRFTPEVMDGLNNAPNQIQKESP